MVQRVGIHEVFKPFGSPTTTYVERDHGKYERKLSASLDTSGELCLLTGPSKTGKTTLYTKVLSDKGLEPILVRCDSSVTAPEFWKRALEKVNFERLSSIQTGKSGKVSGTGKVGGKIGWAWLAGLLGEVSVGIDRSMDEKQIRDRILSQPSPDHLIPILQNLPAVLVVEDFHYLSAHVKKNVFQQWKVFVDEEVSVIVVGTTHHAVELAYANKDLSGRISQIDLPMWNTPDLKKIATKGFEFLKIRVPESVTTAIAEESVGLPIIVQRACYQLLAEKGITEVEQGKTKVQFVKKDAYKALHTVAQTNYASFEAMYERLVTGPKKKARKYDTYELILSTFAQNPLTFSLKRYELDQRLQEIPLPEEKRPPAASVNNALNALANFQRNNDIELLEWSKNQQRLYILEPSFLFYLRMREERESPISLEELIDTLLGKLLR